MHSSNARFVNSTVAATIQRLDQTGCHQKCKQGISARRCQPCIKVIIYDSNSVETAERRSACAYQPMISETTINCFVSGEMRTDACEAGAMLAAFLYGSSSIHNLKNWAPHRRERLLPETVFVFLVDAKLQLHASC